MMVRLFFAGLSCEVSGEAGDSLVADVTRVPLRWRLMSENEEESERGQFRVWPRLKQTRARKTG